MPPRLIQSDPRWGLALVYFVCFQSREPLLSMVCPLPLFLSGFICCPCPFHLLRSSLTGLFPLFTPQFPCLTCKALLHSHPPPTPPPPLIIFTPLVPSHHSGLYANTTAWRGFVGPPYILCQWFFKCFSRAAIADNFLKMSIYRLHIRSLLNQQLSGRSPAICVLLSPIGDSIEH